MRLCVRVYCVCVLCVYVYACLSVCLTDCMLVRVCVTPMPAIKRAQSQYSDWERDRERPLLLFSFKMNRLGGTPNNHTVILIARREVYCKRGH